MKIRLIISLLLLLKGINIMVDNSVKAQELDNPPPNLPPLLEPLKPSSANANPSILPKTLPYTLDTGDIIKINVFDLPEQNGEYQVFMDGTVSVPLIGSFKVEGMTIEQVNQLFSQEYARYLKRPLVTVSLVAQRPLQLAIAGEVNNPGNYTLIAHGEGRKSPTVTDLFAKAGGLTVSADITQIQLKRAENGRERIYTLNFWELLQDGNLDQNVDLRDGDIVIIPKKDVIDSAQNRQLADASFGIKYTEAPNITLVGEVNRPGSYTIPIEEGIPRVTTALRQSGGIKELADIRHIVVKRTTRDGTEQTIPVDLWAMLDTGDIDKDIILQDGDTIVVPTATELHPAEAQAMASANFAPEEITVNVIGSLKNPGATPLPPNSSLNNAILAAGGFDERRANNQVVQLIRFNPNGTVSKREIEINLAAEINEQTNPILKNNDVIVVGRNVMTQVTDGVETLLGPIGRTFSFLNFFNLFR
jgi:polysaccharide export outer membrane protein